MEINSGGVLQKANLTARFPDFRYNFLMKSLTFDQVLVLKKAMQEKFGA